MTSSDATARYARKHLRFGWWCLVVFATTGLVLEGLHGLKLGWYLSVTSETRRMMLTLSHAHGTLLALINIAYAAALGAVGSERQWMIRFSSTCLIASGILLPLGFFLSGLWLFRGDPGLAIVLVPPGAMLLVAGLATGGIAFTDRRSARAGAAGGS